MFNLEALILKVIGYFSFSRMDASLRIKNMVKVQDVMGGTNPSGSRSSTLISSDLRLRQVSILL